MFYRFQYLRFEINIALYDKDLLFCRDQQHGLLPEGDKVDSTSPADLERQRELEKWHEEEMNQQEASLHAAHQLASVDNSQTPSSHARYPTSALEEKDAATHEAILRNARDAKFIIQHNPDLYYTSPTQGRDMWLTPISHLTSMPRNAQPTWRMKSLRPL